MWDSFRNWYSYNQDAITWFLIGWLSFGLLDNLARGQYVWALANAFFIYINYKLRKIRL